MSRYYERYHITLIPAFQTLKYTGACNRRIVSWIGTKFGEFVVLGVFYDVRKFHGNRSSKCRDKERYSIALIFQTFLNPEVHVCMQYAHCQSDWDEIWRICSAWCVLGSVKISWRSEQ